MPPLLVSAYTCVSVSEERDHMGMVGTRSSLDIFKSQLKESNNRGNVPRKNNVGPEILKYCVVGTGARGVFLPT